MPPCVAMVIQAPAEIRSSRQARNRRRTRSANARGLPRSRTRQSGMPWLDADRLVRSSRKRSQHDLARAATQVVVRRHDRAIRAGLGDQQQHIAFLRLGARLVKLPSTSPDSQIGPTICTRLSASASMRRDLLDLVIGLVQRQAGSGCACIASPHDIVHIALVLGLGHAREQDACIGNEITTRFAPQFELRIRRLHLGQTRGRRGRLMLRRCAKARRSRRRYSANARWRCARRCSRAGYRPPSSARHPECPSPNAHADRQYALHDA